VPFEFSLLACMAGGWSEPRWNTSNRIAGGDIAGSFRNGTADHVPWGFYRIEVSAPGCVPESRYVSVFAAEVPILVGLACEFENPALAEENGIALPPYPILRGRVIGPRPAGKELIARMIGVFSSESLEAVVGSGGEFEMSVPRDGKYVLMILDEKNVLAIELVGSPHTGPLEIQLGSSVAAGRAQ
jgi:hypothetical protein